MYSDNREDDEMEIDLVEVFQLMLKRWWLIIGCAVVFAAAAFGYTKLFGSITVSNPTDTQIL